MAIGGSKRNGKKGKKNPTSIRLKPSNPQSNIEGVIDHHPVVAKIPERTNVVDTEYVPINHLVIHAEGDVWRVNYFRQLAGLSDELNSLQQGTLPAHQQYEKLVGFEIKVDSPLSQSQDSETKEFKVTGDGGITYGVIPNQGDMFVADIGNGVSGLFTIVQSTRMSYTKQSTYQVEYEMVAEYKDDWEKELTNKVVSEYVFVKELIENYKKPFLTSIDHKRYISLNENYELLKDYFMDRFWSKDTRSIVVPAPGHTYYDGFHSSFCKYIGLGDILKPIEVYEYGRFKMESVSTFWNIITDNLINRGVKITKNFAIAATWEFKHKHVARGIGWTGYYSAIFPKELEFEIDHDTSHVSTFEPTTDILVQSEAPRNLPEPLAGDNLLSGRPLYHSVTFDPYVVSEAFYSGERDKMSVMELLLHRGLSGEDVDRGILEVLCGEIFAEPYISQYYYIPVLLVLLSMATGDY